MREIRELRTRFRKLGRKVGRYSTQPEHLIHVEYKDAHRQYNRAIKYSKRHHWRDWLEKASDLDLWTANKYISAAASDGGRTRILTLRATENSQEITTSSKSIEEQAVSRILLPEETNDVDYSRPMRVPPTDLRNTQNFQGTNTQATQTPQAIQSPRARRHSKYCPHKVC